MSLAADTACEVMGWEPLPDHGGWGRPGRTPIGLREWRPQYDLNQALEVLSHVTRGAEYRIECYGGAAPLYVLEARGLTEGPGLSLPELMCRLALAVVREP